MLLYSSIGQKYQLAQLNSLFQVSQDGNRGIGFLGGLLSGDPGMNLPLSLFSLLKKSSPYKLGK